jgi:glutaminase
MVDTAFISLLETIYHETRGLDTGKVADYIPQLADVNPEMFGVAFCDIQGNLFRIGDASIDFCLQSCSKPLNYCLARVLHHENPDAVPSVHDYVGYEPSGREFNSFVLNRANLPHNPLINAGAIMVASLIRKEDEPSSRFAAVQAFYQRMAGKVAKIGFDNGVFLSEKHHADRNISLAYYMRENNAFGAYPTPSQLQDHLELYYQGCSVTITCEVGAVMAGTLANHGTCPSTGDQIMTTAIVQDVLSIMYGCGMYDFSGQFAFNVGLPAKSGVSGCMLLVIPNVGGICIWSPRLDEMGNSVRGVEFCQQLTRRTQARYHIFRGLTQAHIPTSPEEMITNRATTVQRLIHAAAAGNQDDMCAILGISLGAEDTEMQSVATPAITELLNTADYDGRTALHLAAEEGHLSMVRLLLLLGVNSYPKDRWGNTPYHEAHKLWEKSKTTPDDDDGMPRYRDIRDLLHTHRLTTRECGTPVVEIEDAANANQIDDDATHAAGAAVTL